MLILSDYTRLFESAASKDAVLFNQYIDSVTDLEYKNENGWTLLIVAAYNHSYHIVNILLEKGANINAINSKGTTVFMYAKTKVIENGNLFFLDHLIANGADIRAKDIFGKTVLDYLQEKNISFLVEYLMNYLNEK